jgi:transcription-repair coupling factor (superfamily II helicase)
LIREAIEFEIARGGQVFFVHNRVDTIYEMKGWLENLVPGLRVVVGHGRWTRSSSRTRCSRSSTESTTCCSRRRSSRTASTSRRATRSSSITRPVRALAALPAQGPRRPQRPARVLLSARPFGATISSDARKRLAAIQEFADLGAGFRIAARDLEIRGSGNLLGGEQSGEIAAVGFEMYTKLLEETIAELRGEKVEEAIETTINLGVAIYIPHDYIPDENLRMMFYKKIASAKDAERLGEIRLEMRDRFGALPEDVDRLFRFVELKLRAGAMGVHTIARDGKKIAVKFAPQAKIDPNRLLLLLGENRDARFSPSGVLTIPAGPSAGQLLEGISGLLDSIAM